MASTRMTRYIREAIQSKLIQRAFKDRAQEHVDRCADFAVRVYRDVMAPHLELMATLPKGWLPTDNDLNVYMSGQMARLCFNGSLGNGRLTSSLCEGGAKEVFPAETTMNERYGGAHLPFPQRMLGNQCLKQYDAHDPFAVEYSKLCHEQKELVEEIERTSRSVNAALEKVSTVNKLIEIWPEAADFARPYLVNGEQRAILPAIPREELNQRLGLPPSTDEVAGGTVA